MNKEDKRRMSFNIIDIIVVIMLIAVTIILWPSHKISHNTKPITIQNQTIHKPIQNQIHKPIRNQTKQKMSQQKQCLITYTQKNSFWVGGRHVGLPKSIAKKIVKSIYKHKRPLVLLAIAQTESHFNPMAFSKSSVGICQINLINVNELEKAGIIKCPSELLEVNKNFWAASYLLEKMVKSSGSIQRGLELYFGKCKQNRKYRQKVLTNLGHICLQCNSL